MSKNETKTDETNEQQIQLLAEEIPKELKNWMTNISSKLKDIPLWKLTIPGIYSSNKSIIE